MAAFTRSNRVTKSRFACPPLSYFSSGSEHSADDNDNDSPCLSELVHGFLEDDCDCDSDSLTQCCDSDADRRDLVSDSVEDAADLLRSVLDRDAFRNLLFSRVLKAMERFWSLRNQKSALNRKVMVFLRELGYNAAICKTKWETCGGLTAGSYEFIDVVQPSSAAASRYIVDLDFAAQFEVARPTGEYMKLFELLPRVFVGRSEELKRIIKVICDGAKRSLKSRELSLPPWRKNRYMQNKWMGPYRRTSNPAPLTATDVSGVKCRFVGFDDGVSGRLFVRTR